MRVERRIALWAAACAATASCSLALDIDALQGGGGDTELPPCSSAADCDDLVACTIDACQEDGTCVNVPDNSVCADLEVCDAEQGCVPTGDECDENADCDDGVACTIDTCQIGSCVNQADDAYCESDDPCIENETCDPAACPGEEGCDTAIGCLPGDEKFCEQSGLPCTVTACDSETPEGECVDELEAGADDDADTYYDAECGGDDCDDADGDVHPGVAESCDGLDNDCDGLTDAAAIIAEQEIDVADAIAPPSLAAGGDLAFITWQRGADETGSVHAVALGMDGALVAGALDFTGEAGEGDAGVGMDPDVVSGGGSDFLVAWVADGPSTSPRATVIEFAVDVGAGTITGGAPIPIGSDAATAISLPRIAWDGAGSGWVVGYAATYSGSVAVELATEDMHSETASAFPVSSAAGAVDGLSVAVLGADSYAVAYSREDASTDGDSEVFATEIELVSELWAHGAGFPLGISSAEADAWDPSFRPSITAVGAGAWAAAYEDTLPLGATTPTDIVARTSGGATVSLVDLGAVYYQEPSLAYDGSAFGLLYLVRVGTYESLEFLSLDAALAVAGEPYGGTQLATTTGANGTGGGRLVAVGAGRFAAVWVERIGDEDHLEFSEFEVCGASE